MGFVSLKYDFSFKNLMGNEEVRKYFVSDVLGIPPEEIKSVRLKNPYLWKQYIRQKQGIMDMLLEMNNDSKVNIELQVRKVKYWDKRALFYLYHLLDEDGYRFSDMFEIHIIELKKQLEGRSQVDDWIRLFNARTKEDLDMIKTENPGILAAIRELKIMNLGRGLIALYEMRMKDIRDGRAMDEYAYDEAFQRGEAAGKAAGEAAGEAQGEARGKARGAAEVRICKIRKKMAKNISIEDMADMLEEEVPFVREVCGLIKANPAWDDGKIFARLSEKPE